MNLNIDTLNNIGGTAKQKRLAKYAYQSMQKGIAKDKRWLARFLTLPTVSLNLYSENYSHTDDDDEEVEVILSTLYEKSGYIERVLQTVDVFNSKFGDDWDILISYRYGGFRIAFLHIYEEVQITNSSGHEHIIRDLVTTFSWYMSSSSSETFCFEMTGARISLAPKELYCNYQHSHLSSRSGVTEDINIDFMSTSYFCLGDGEITELFDIINVEEFDPQRLELLLYGIDQYVAWESLEGGPFRKIEDMAVKKKQAYDWEAERVSVAHNLISFAERNPLDVDFYLSQGRIRIKSNYKTLQAIKELYKEKTSVSEHWKAIFVKYSPGLNTWFSLKSEREASGIFNLSNHLKTAHFFYRGERKSFKVDRRDENINLRNPQAENPDEYTLHPKLLKYVISRLESSLYQRAVRIGRLARQGAANHSR